MKKLLTILLLLISASAFSQADTLNPYRGAYTDMKSPYHFKKATKYDSMIWARKARFEDSVAFRGKTYVPMAPNGDSSNQAASTKWVKQNVIGGGGGGYDYSGKLDSVRRLSDLTVVEYSGSPSAVIGNPIYKDSVGVTALFRSVGTDSVYAVINGLAVYQFKDSSGSGGSDSTAYVNGLVVNDSTLRLYRFNGDSSDFEIKGNGNGRYLKLTGTDGDGLMTGAVDFYDGARTTVNIKPGDGDESGKITFTGNNPTLEDNSTFYDVSGIYWDFEGGASQTSFLSNEDSKDAITIFSNVSGFKGLQGLAYYGANYNDSTFVQKKYVDSVAGVTTMATIGGTPNAEGASISGNTLTLHPASASFGGVLTTGAQGIGGVKTFSAAPVFSSGFSSASTATFTGNMNLSSAGQINLGLSRQFFVTSTGGSGTGISLAGANNFSTSGTTRQLFQTVPSLTHGTGTNSHTMFDAIPVINTSGGTNTVIGFNYAPTNTAVTGTTSIGFRNTTGNNTLNTSSGGTVVGASTLAGSAKLQVDATDKGFLPPRMTATQAEAISSPDEGLLVYATNGTGSVITAKGWWGYNGSAWRPLTPSTATTALTHGTTTTWDFLTSINKTWTITGNSTLAITNDEDGSTGVLLVTQDGTGGRTITFPVGDNTTGVTQNTAAGAKTLYTYIKLGSVRYWNATLR